MDLSNKSKNVKNRNLSIKQFNELPIDKRTDKIAVKELIDSVDVLSDMEDRTAVFIITTSTPDTDSDVIVPNGIDFTHYNRNPVVLWQHDRDQLPLGKCINLEPMANGWKATVKFAPVEGNPMAEQVYQLVKSGYLSAVSIGFLPTDIEPNQFGGLTINKCYLFEFSIVTVPANPEALIVSVKSAKADTDIDNSSENTSTENEAGLEPEPSDDEKDLDDNTNEQLAFYKAKMKARLNLLNNFTTIQQIEED